MRVIIALLALVAVAYAANSCRKPKDGVYSCTLPAVEGYVFEIIEDIGSASQPNHYTQEVRSNGCIYQAEYYSTNDNEEWVTDKVDCLTDCSVIGYGDCNAPVSTTDVDFQDDDDCTQWSATSFLGNEIRCERTGSVSAIPSVSSSNSSPAAHVTVSMAVLALFAALAFFM
eukprot:TRINITY_DN9266_c0_g1_i1.p2 TRINITY_DN9266_c0_g1~~TRINITY_DN9266_c0_g1_i1.p2  ORF type:complete len:181 (+),score=54.45 TRINITY_DN9266_c0_g1_i1:31-543(+)